MAFKGTITWDTRPMQASLSDREGNSFEGGSQHAFWHTKPHLGGAGRLATAFDHMKSSRAFCHCSQSKTSYPQASLRLKGSCPQLKIQPLLGWRNHRLDLRGSVINAQRRIHLFIYLFTYLFAAKAASRLWMCEDIPSAGQDRRDERCPLAFLPDPQGAVLQWGGSAAQGSGPGQSMLS